MISAHFLFCTSAPAPNRTAMEIDEDRTRNREDERMPTLSTANLFVDTSENVKHTRQTARQLGNRLIESRLIGNSLCLRRRLACRFFCLSRQLFCRLCRRLHNRLGNLCHLPGGVGGRLRHLCGCVRRDLRHLRDSTRGCSGHCATNVVDATRHRFQLDRFQLFQTFPQQRIRMGIKMGSAPVMPSPPHPTAQNNYNSPPLFGSHGGRCLCSEWDEWDEWNG